MEINWYPGHMAKARRLLQEQLRAVDAVVEVCDARAPSASRNMDLDALCAGKARVLALNKSDLADDQLTARWLARYRAEGLEAVKLNSASGSVRDIKALLERAVAPAVERMRARGANKTARAMVVGIPNAGKSTIINRLKGGGTLKTGDRPGITRANQWVKIGPYLELLDTPGMLWPKLIDQSAARTLAFLGTVPDDILDKEALAEALLARLMELNPEATLARFKLDKRQEGESLLEGACRGRGWLISGGRPDTSRGAALALDEFRAGKVAKITFDRP